MVLLYPGPLPHGALVRVTMAQLKAPDPEVWLDASAGITLSEAGRVTGWTSRGTRPAMAMPVSENPTGTGFQSTPPALRFETGENGGLKLSDAIADGSRVTLGLIITPGLPEARTLLSLQPASQGDYVFLSLEGRRLRLARKDAALGLSATLPDAGQRPLLILCALGNGMARLSVNGADMGGTRLAVEGGLSDLFIGCRNDRKGMRNKLGRFDLSDVMVWPGMDLLGAGADLAAVKAVWDDRCRRGL